MTSAKPERTVSERATPERIARELVDDMLRGRIAPGEALDEAVLAARFSSSRTPVREALAWLRGNGLVELRERRHCVARYEGEELGELFEAMNEIEALAARMASMRMPHLLRSELAMRQEECRDAAEHDDLDAFLSANEAFHLTLYRGTGNRFIEKLAADFRRRTASARKAKYNGQSDMLEAVVEHDRIVALIEDAEHDAAAREARAHVSKTLQRILVASAKRIERAS